jgi:hypothetical protein
MSKSIHPKITQMPQVNTSSYLCFNVLSLRAACNVLERVMNGRKARAPVQKPFSSPVRH